MDYCCELYVYYSVGDFYKIYVGKNRTDPDSVYPCPDFMDDSISKEQLKAEYDKHMESVKNRAMEPIGLPYDGESFNAKTPERAVEILKELKELGYIFPDYVIEEIEAEAEKGEL